ncbi:MAG: aminotransferase class V-fold PLP-dependent enzyme [Synergistaceae bacterium]|jgi:cysteine desulfurase family protein|nr:aminotransferase class V-fold PLP-dependent enzyme [Synergistaceae bacterium]
MAIYLDNGATSYPKPESVCSAVTDYMRNNGASPGRGNYERARDADTLVYRTRKLLCKLLGAKRPGQIIFTSNATESLNLALKGYLKPEDSVLTTSYEHNAMWRPLKKMEDERNIKIRQIPCAPDGRADIASLHEYLRGVTLVAVSHGSNVTGCVTPLDEITAAAHKQNIPVLTDAAQTAGVYPIDVTGVPIDMLAFTGHKGLMGPTGTGGLYIREGMELGTLKEGGTGGMSSSPYPPSEPPDRYEAGTMNICGLAGLHAALTFIIDAGVDDIREHEINLTKLLLEGLDTIPRLKYYGPSSAEDRLGLVSFNIEGHDPNKVALTLDSDYGIMVRSGLHCAPQAHRLLGTEHIGAVRVSLGYFNQKEDVDLLIDAVRHIAA